MAYYETDVGGTLDANGALTLRLGPLSERGLHFLGYFVGQIDGGSNSATYQVETKNGFPLAYAAGDLVVIGPIWIPANDYKVLQISGGTPGGSLKGQITGDSNRKFDDLLVRPSPTSGAAPPTDVSDRAARLLGIVSLAAGVGTDKSANKNNAWGQQIGATSTVVLIAGVAGQTITLYWLATMLEGLAAGQGLNWQSTSGVAVCQFAAPNGVYISAPPISWPFGFALPIGDGLEVVNGTGSGININGMAAYTQA